MTGGKDRHFTATRLTDRKNAKENTQHGKSARVLAPARRTKNISANIKFDWRAVLDVDRLGATQDKGKR